MQQTEGLWDPRRLADYLGVSIRTVYDWRYKGEGPPGIRVGGQVRYRPAEVERWLERGDKAGAAANGR